MNFNRLIMNKLIRTISKINSYNKTFQIMLLKILRKNKMVIMKEIKLQIRKDLIILFKRSQLRQKVKLIRKKKRRYQIKPKMNKKHKTKEKKLIKS